MFGMLAPFHQDLKETSPTVSVWRSVGCLCVIKTPVIFTRESRLLSKLQLYLTRSDMRITMAKRSPKSNVIWTKLQTERLFSMCNSSCSWSETGSGSPHSAAGRRSVCVRIYLSTCPMILSHSIPLKASVVVFYFWWYEEVLRFHPPWQKLEGGGRGAQVLEKHTPLSGAGVRAGG